MCKTLSLACQASINIEMLYSNCQHH